VGAPLWGAEERGQAKFSRIPAARREAKQPRLPYLDREICSCNPELSAIEIEFMGCLCRIELTTAICCQSRFYPNQFFTERESFGIMPAVLLKVVHVPFI